MCTIEETINAIIENTEYTLDEATEIANERHRIVEKMKVGECCFAFIKKDGSIRNAIGTLKDVDYDFKKEEFEERQNNPLVQTYFDLEKNAWRTFKVERLVV